MNYIAAAQIFYFFRKKLLLIFLGHPLAEASYEFGSVHSSVRPFARQDLRYDSSVFFKDFLHDILYLQSRKREKVQFLKQNPVRSGGMKIPWNGFFLGFGKNVTHLYAAF